MIGIIVRYGSKVVIATGPSQGYCEEIALDLFREEGLDLEGVELPIIIFNPLETGGVLLDPAMLPEGGEPMDGWSLDGWEAPPGSS